MFKKILALGYDDFFIDGFRIQDFNSEYKLLSKKKRAIMLENVIEALNLNLKYYSSPERQLKYMSMKERQNKMV